MKAKENKISDTATPESRENPNATEVAASNHRSDVGSGRGRGGGKGLRDGSGGGKGRGGGGLGGQRK